MTNKIKNKDYTCSMDLRVKHEDDRGGEAGRSMVEMLGTLAIIGVLSVGGIAGYTYGMNRYYTNELLAGASARAVIVSSQISFGQTASLSEFDKMKDTAGGTFDGTVKEFDDGIGIKVSKVKKVVCENLIKETEGTDIGIETEAVIIGYPALAGMYLYGVKRNISVATGTYSKFKRRVIYYLNKSVTTYKRV